MAYLGTKPSDKHDRLESLMECQTRRVSVMEHSMMKQAEFARQRMEKLEKDLEGDSRKRDLEAAATRDASRSLEARIAAVELKELAPATTSHLSMARSRLGQHRSALGVCPRQGERHQLSVRLGLLAPMDPARTTG